MWQEDFTHALCRVQSWRACHLRVTELLAESQDVAEEPEAAEASPADDEEEVTFRLGHLSYIYPTASELILEWGVEEARPEGRQRGMGFLGRGQPAPSHQLGGLRERCKLPQWCLGRSPGAEGFSCILSRHIAFPSISVRVAYSLHG